MTIYNGVIPNDFLEATIEFSVDLPGFVENQEFKLYEKVGEDNVEIMDFQLLLNNGEDIATAENGVATYTGSILPTDVETNVIAQLKIDREAVDSFKNRKFMLEVV